MHVYENWLSISFCYFSTYPLSLSDLANEMVGWLFALVQKPKLYGWAIEKQLNSHFEVLSHVFLAPVAPQTLSFQIGEQAIRPWEP